MSVSGEFNSNGEDQDDFDPAQLPPLGTRAEFQSALQALVQEEAPRLFALCEEVGDRADGYVEFWGIAFDDRAEVVSVRGSTRGRFSSAESAQRIFSFGANNLHLMWV